MGLVDGLGGEEVNQTVTSTATISGTNVYAATSINTPTGNITTVNSTTLSGADIRLSGDVELGAGSPFNQGIVVPLTARAIISGGMFVSASGNLAYPAPASTKWPLGVAQSTVASGAKVNIITHGVVPVVAESAIAIGAPAMMGAGGALNTVVAATAASGIRTFGVLSTAGSEGTVFILL